jgi:GT2 family glycosyltransferase
MPDGTSWPKITIVTPSFNQGHFLEQTIRSVLLQGYPNLEYIVIDGGSSDASVEIIRNYEPWLARWVSEKDQGQSHAINKGLMGASGPLSGWLNSDDLLLPGALHHLGVLYAANAQAVAWVGGCCRIDVHGNVLSVVHPGQLSPTAIARWRQPDLFYQPSCFFSSEAFGAVGGLDQNIHYALDLDLWLRLRQRGAFATTPQILSAATIHGDAKTQAQRNAMHAETIAVQIRHGFREAAYDRLQYVASQSRPRSVGVMLKMGVRALLFNQREGTHPATLDEVVDSLRAVSRAR